MEARDERVGRNEALFREVNERIEDLNKTFAVLTETFLVVCECGDGTCVEQIELQTGDYERVRRDGATFIVVPGHELPDVEDVVDRRDGYVVVRKREGGPAELAEALDPRDPR